MSRHRLFTAAVLAVLSAISAWAGYFVMFSRFVDYDDEGYVMISLKYFMRGFPLYDNVYTQYGPGYYFLRAAVYPLIGASHDRGRLFSLAIWILIALLIALYTYHITRSVTIATLAQLLTFRLLAVLANTPGHPQELGGLILAFALMLPLNYQGWVLLGVLAGILLQIKINVGLLFVISLGMLFPGRLRHASLATAALLPTLLMRHHLTTAWGLQYWFVATTSIIAASLAILRRKDLPQLPLRDAYIGVRALVITVMAISGATLLLGTSMKGLIYGIVLQHITFANRFEIPLPFRAVVIPAALLAFVLALVVPRSSKAIAALRIGFCIVVAFLAGSGRGDLLILFAAPYLWLGMTSGGLRRVFVCAVALLQILQAYPIAGSQRAFGSFLIVPIALCGVGKALKELLPNEVWVWPKYRTAVFLILTASFSAERAFIYEKAYYSYSPLNFPGASRIRLPAAQAMTYRNLVERLTTSCDSFITAPGMNSLYFWTEKEPPTHLNTTQWPRLLNDEQQQEVVRQFAHYSRACVVLNGARVSQNGQRFPLVAYIASNFHEVECIGEYTFMMRNDR